MSNLFADPNAWNDGSNTPPIWWSPENLRYEVLIDLYPSSLFFAISSDIAADDGNIAFAYEIDALNNEGMAPDTPELAVIRDWGGENEILFSAALTEFPASGNVNVPVVAGQTYRVGIIRTETPDSPYEVYDLTATLTPVPDPAPYVPIDRKVTIAISKDGGHNFGSQREASLGELGKYKQTIVFRRFGTARDFRAKIRVTSPVVADFMGGVVEYEAAD